MGVRRPCQPGIESIFCMQMTSHVTKAVTTLVNPVTHLLKVVNGQCNDTLSRRDPSWNDVRWDVSTCTNCTPLSIRHHLETQK
jgi:hypothetical protein